MQRDRKRRGHSLLLHRHVTANLVTSHPTGSLEGADCISSRDDGQLGHQTQTSTRFSPFFSARRRARSLSVSRQATIASLILASASSSVFPCVWQPGSAGQLATM